MVLIKLEKRFLGTNSLTAEYDQGNLHLRHQSVTLRVFRMNNIMTNAWEKINVLFCRKHSL